VGQGTSVTAANAVALGQGSAATRANTVSVGSAGNERQLANVKAGTAPTDAANVSQVDEALATAKTYSDAGDVQTLSAAKAYADQKFLGAGVTQDDFNSFRNQVDDQFRAVDRRLDQVGAMGTAMAQMAFSTQGINQPNRLGVGIGGYGDRTALAVGYSRQVGSNASVTFGGAVSGNQSSAGVGVGIGW
ncbi:MAG TPA: YadA C-terminal domain-containing protein, partial [Dyella sp.]|nr:YadA C-terminal domain-containing protein [Dyella sp.]